jgi:HlyD family secretion protein
LACQRKWGEVMKTAMLKTSLALTAVLAAGTLAGCGKPAPATGAKAPQPLTVTVAPVEMRPLAEGLTASGLLVSREESGVSSELSGYRVSQVLVDEDAWVKKGQPLARLDDTLLRAQIAQQQANLAQQEVAYERAKAEADRVKGLDNQGVLSNEQISERRLAAKSAEAAVGVAKAGLNDLKTRQSRMTITAPVSGRVLERTARPGDTSSPGTTLFRIARDGLVEMDAEISEADLAQIKPGFRATVTLPSEDKVAGAVRFVAPRVDAQTKLGHARIALPVRSDLRPGGFARAVFQGSTHPVLAVPASAVHFDASGGSVMTVDASNHVHPAAVKTGARSQGYVELVQGPPVGTKVALGGGVFLLDGDKVQPVAAQPGAAGAKAAGQ